MNTAMIHPPRRTEAICPPWCEGHSGGYQGWENRGDDGRQQRDHGGRDTHVSDATVGLVQTEQEDHTLGAPIVALYLDGVGGFGNVDLTPAQARELAAVLVEKAAQAEEARA